MKYCNKCNNGIDSNAEVCPICGEKQSVDAIPVQDNYNSYNQNYSGIPNAAPKPVGTAIASFIIGIVSLVLCNTVVGPIVGLILGIMGVRSYDENKNSSKWMGIVGIVLNALSIAALIIAIIAMIWMYLSGEPDIVINSIY